MSEQSEIGSLKVPRRSFLKGLAAAGLAAITGQRLAVPTPEVEAARLVLPGDLLPKVLPDARQSFNQTESVISLPERERDDRVWKEVETTVKPPGAYRSAMCWSEKQGGFLLHGGWGNEGSHNQTWLFKENQWKKLEAGLTPNLHGHKMVDTPLGVIMYGGLSKQEDGSYADSNQFFILNQDQKWGKLNFKWEMGIYYNLPVPAKQGVGMVYNPETKSVWILGGGVGSPVVACDSTLELFLPGAFDPQEWYLKGMGYMGNKNYKQLFEPLAYCFPGDPATYLYGGIGPDGNGNILPSIVGYKIVNEQTNIRVENSNLPIVDYGGPLRGGYDLQKKELVLHAGSPVNIWSPPYQETIETKNDDSQWFVLKSPSSPPVYGKPAVALNPRGEMLRFGGSFYDQNNNPRFSDATWLCNPIFKTYFPNVVS